MMTDRGTLKCLGNISPTVNVSISKGLKLGLCGGKAALTARHLAFIIFVFTSHVEICCNKHVNVFPVSIK
jgi:hypothetical protein